ncbi:MAG: caspase family protein [Fusobacteriaceae bacterium]
MAFNKYAILIGINDYEVDTENTYQLKPLKACVKDIQNIKDVLIKKCGFKKKNIYSIESYEGHTEKEIRNKIEMFLDEISQTFENETDSIYFQFSGHGVLSDDLSYIMLHSSPLKILEIPDIIGRRIIPKYQFYTFDCCHCGQVTYVRGKESEAENLNEFFKKSDGIDILYACKKNQVALETENGGKLTNSIIKIISDLEYYDKDSILSSGILIDFVKKEMIEEKQEPIGFSQTTGYYPFAAREFWEDEVKDEKKIDEVEVQETKERSFNINYSSIYKQRLETINVFFKIVESCIDEIFKEYNIKYSEDVISKLLVKDIFKSLDYIPFESGLEKRKIIPKNNSLIQSYAMKILGNYNYEYEYLLRENSEKKLINYVFGEKFQSIFGIGFIILPIKFGVSVSVVSTDIKFGEENQKSEIKNYYFEAFSKEKLKEKKNVIHNFIKEQIEFILKKQKETNQIYDENLFKEYIDFQEVITKL